MSRPRCAVIGQPISHSLSPVLHNAAYAALGLSGWRYERHEVSAGGLPGFLAGLGAEWVGLSVTMPLKREALAVADESNDLAQRVGAANTLLRTAGGWRAENTDVLGFADALGEVGLAKAERVVILGAGGTAQAALGMLPDFTSGPVTLVVRDPGRAGEAVATAERCGVELAVTTDAASAISDADLIISTVPAGVADAWAECRLRPGAVVFDVVYRPWPTVFALAAQWHGCRVVSGLELLLHQAAHQVTAMTGFPAPLPAMRYALGETMSTQTQE